VDGVFRHVAAARGPGREGGLVARALSTAVAATGLWTIATTFGAGFVVHLGSLRLASNEPVRPLVVTALAAGLYLLLFGPARLVRDLTRLTRISPRLAHPAAISLALLTMALGLRYGTWFAGGSDSYGYVSQADLWLKGDLHISQPWVAQFDWPFADRTFAPLGYRPGLIPNTIVPTYAPGVAMLMALAKLVAGTAGPFLVTPLLAALGVWLTFCLGRKLVGPVEGFLASLLIATSPAILMIVMLPWSDIPAMACWTLALVLVISGGRFSAFLAGLAASMAILIRPNVVPLAAVIGLAAMFRPRNRPSRFGSVVSDGLLFAAGVAPGVLAVAFLNTRLYGSPLESGYGPLSLIYGPSHSIANVRRWAAWLWETQPAVVVLALVGLVAPGALMRRGAIDGARPGSPRLLIVGVAAVTMACYLFYTPFDDWPFLRFLFPMFPALMVLAAAGFTAVVRRLRESWRVPLAVVCLVAVVSSQVRAGRDRYVFDNEKAAAHWLAVAHEVERLVPDNAVIICVQESGSLRYYAHRLTLRWDWLPPEWLDGAIDQLQAKGYRPYILLAEEEQQEFRGKFSGTSAGRLAEKPVAEFPPTGKLYDALAARHTPLPTPPR
jgi:hypothetical protein